MLRYLGYACLCSALPDSSPRGTLLRNASPERLRALIGENLARLERVLCFNVAHDIRLFRISSDLIPFGSHPVNDVPWWEEYAAPLAALGGYVRANGLRVSLHPGQYTVLSAPRESVLAAAIRDLIYHTRLLDALGLDATHKIIVHGGGIYGDKAAALRRWAEQYRRLAANVRARLVVENDARLFGIEDVLELSAATGAPVVMDVFHHRAYSGSSDGLTAFLRRAFATWDPPRDGVPKIHYSTQAAGQRPGAHAAWVDAEEFLAFLAVAPAEVPFDCMLEAKAKEQAWFRVRQALARAA
ncbi:MAG TPA: UV DNA damage repair endonuclease UvsE [Chloroflexota bacterium]|jgi:UV DNA damage endonuclease